MAVSDILCGAASMWFAPYGETVPDRDSVDYGDDWGGNWEALGVTTAPLAWSRSLDTFEIEVQQELNPLDEKPVKEVNMFETTLAEITAANLALAVDGVAATVAAGSGTVGYETVTGGGKLTLSRYAIGFEGVYQDASNNEFPVRMFIWRAIPRMSGNLEFSKNATVGIPIQFKALSDRTKPVNQRAFLWERVTAAALP